MTTYTSKMENFNSDHQSKNQLSEIQSFYKDMTVFLTGGTGFMGNLILEKLMRTCSGVKRVYILIREKKGKTPEERFQDIFDNSLFELMKKEQPNFMEKISAIIGDCELPNLGIGEQHQEIIKNEVNVVIHSAATVKFDEHLRIATNINVIALQDMLKLAKEMKNLKSFIHISTAYSNCAGREVVDEVFYKPAITGEQLVQLVKNLDDDYITNITPTILREWPNTYAMTKAIAESEVLVHGKGLPIGIIRPSMIIATESEPVPGWINNVYGPTGVVAATGVGLLRVMRADPDKTADVIPGDFVSNAVLASAWDVQNQWKEYQNSISKTKSDRVEPFTPPIFNIVSSSSNRLTWSQFSNTNIKYGLKVPSVKLIWPIMIKLSKNKYEYLTLCFLLHTIPAYIIDFIALITGGTPKLVDGYRKIEKFTEVLSYFSLKSWKFNDNNTIALISRLSKLDQSLFNFNVAKLDWEKYFESHVSGVRTYILKDPIDTIPEGIKHDRRLNMAYYTLLSIFVALLLLVIYQVLLIFN